MSTFEEETVNSLQRLFSKIEYLKEINIRDLLKPEVYFHYEQTIQEAYDAFTKVGYILHNSFIR